MKLNYFQNPLDFWKLMLDLLHSLFFMYFRMICFCKSSVPKCMSSSFFKGFENFSIVLCWFDYLRIVLLMVGLLIENIQMRFCQFLDEYENLFFLFWLISRKIFFVNLESIKICIYWVVDFLFLILSSMYHLFLSGDQLMYNKVFYSLLEE